MVFLKGIIEGLRPKRSISRFARSCVWQDVTHLEIVQVARKLVSILIMGTLLCTHNKTNTFLLMLFMF